MPNYAISGTTVGSGFNAVAPNPIVPCTIISARPGVTHRRIWTNPVPPGITPNDDNGNNLNVTFAWRDNYGLPTLASNNAPNVDDYVAGAQTTNAGATTAYQCDLWIVVPAGINTIRLGSRPFGTCAIGLYAGKSFRYANRLAWNVSNFQTGNLDLSAYNLLCGNRIVAARLFVANGYLNGGYFLQISTDLATFIDTPTAWCHGDQPYQSSWGN